MAADRRRGEGGAPAGANGPHDRRRHERSPGENGHFTLRSLAIRKCLAGVTTPHPDEGSRARNGFGAPPPKPGMALDPLTAAVIGVVIVFFFVLFLFLRHILASFNAGYEERRHR